MSNNAPWHKIEALLEELIAQQNRKVIECASEILPNLTEDDLLQPNDFPELENNPFFRYEEGALCGLQTARMALFAMRNDLRDCETIK